MKSHNSILYILLFIIISTRLCYGVSLKNIDQTIYEVDKINRNIKISALLLSNDTIISGSVDGIWARFSQETPWKKLLDCQNTDSGTWVEYCHKRKRWDFLYEPEQLQYLSITNDIVIFDNLCGCLYKYNILDNKNYATEWIKGQKRDYFQSARIYREFILLSFYSHDAQKVGIKYFDDLEYQRIFSFPDKLGKLLDSLGSTEQYVLPACAPNDSIIWLAVRGYNFIYQIDFSGIILDSILITASDFRLPQPPKSRIRSRAVWEIWLSQWTPITSFEFIPPSYFILQYRTGWEEQGADTVPLYSTLMWNTDHQPMEIEVDRHWQIAGVQPDGRIIFAHYLIEGDKRKIVLNITRIVP